MTAESAAPTTRPAGEYRGAADAPRKVDTPVRVRPCVEDLWDCEGFRCRVREIARKAKKDGRYAPPNLGEGDEHLMPEIRDLKRRSYEILEERKFSKAKEVKVISSSDSSPIHMIAYLVDSDNPVLVGIGDLRNSETYLSFFFRYGSSAPASASIDAHSHLFISKS